MKLRRNVQTRAATPHLRLKITPRDKHLSHRRRRHTHAVPASRVQIAVPRLSTDIDLASGASVFPDNSAAT